MDGIRKVLSPLFFISYVLGIRIVQFVAGESRLLCSFFYILLLWSIYLFLYLYTVIHYMINSVSDSNTSYLRQIYYWLNISIVLLSIFLGIYHDKEYRNCLKQLDVLDDTLKKIGMVTDYQKLYTKMLLIIFGWLVYIICIYCARALWYRDNYVLYSFYISFMYDYPSYVNILDDLLITSTLGYVELKFEQINEYIQKLDGISGCEIKQAWEHSALLPCQIGYSKSMSSEYATWVIIHLHLELCKISRELNSIFELQMTIKMGAYFTFIAIMFRGIFKILFLKYYQNGKKILGITLGINFVVLNIFRLFIMNYMCEKVSAKANATGDIINRIPYSTFNVVSRENISQFLLQISLTPLKFYGLGLFRFGLKFLYGFSSSVSTVIVILAQSYTET